MYPDSMFTFTAVSNQLGIEVSEILEILDCTIDDFEEDISVSEIIEMLIDCGLEIDSPNSYYAHA